MAFPLQCVWDDACRRPGSVTKGIRRDLDHGWVTTAGVTFASLLIGIAQRLFSGQKASDVVAFDVNAFFKEIGLDRFVTNQRRIGLDGMIKRIKSSAQSIAAMDHAKGNGDGHV